MQAFLSMGSNLGDRLDYLARAVASLNDSCTSVVGTSSVYETEPQGKLDQPAFLNLVAEAKTERTPRQLLEQIQAVERALGRERHERWGPRTIDIDILLCGDLIVDEGDLQVPHPRMMERAFVLIPLQEVCPGAPLPDGYAGLWVPAVAAVSKQGVTALHDADSFIKRVTGIK